MSPPALAEAIARDTLSAAAESAAARILLITDDEEWTDGVEAEVIVDAEPGLLPALEHGLGFCEGPTVILLGDLPGLRAQEINTALEVACGRALTMVADTAGTGTTLTAARTPGNHRLRFGPDSARLHRRAGYQPLTLPADSGLRRDVDSLTDLAEAAHLGPRTRALLDASAAHPGPTAPLPTLSAPHGLSCGVRR